MPQLDVTTWPSQLFWLAITFLALYIVISRIAIPRTGGVIEKRKATISGVGLGTSTPTAPLPGIGATKAAAILAYRQEHGAFKTVDELDNVSGIGPATLGGCIAAGLSGPRRAYAGAARHAVLGIRMLDGK